MRVREKWHVQVNRFLLPNANQSADTLLQQFRMLLLVSPRETVETLQASLREAMQVTSPIFHEGLPLRQRDRQRRTQFLACGRDLRSLTSH